MNKKKATNTRSRSAITGRFVEKKYADKHPKNTVTERIDKKPKKKPSN